MASGRRTLNRRSHEPTRDGQRPSLLALLRNARAAFLLIHLDSLLVTPGIMDTLQANVVIAGGGIGGVVLAALLTRAGRRVIVLERGLGPPPFLRPEVLWPAAAETLFSLRPREFWEEKCLRPFGGAVLDRAGISRPVITGETFQRAGVQPFLTHPNQTRETLLAICGADVRRGVEVTGVIREHDKVRGVRAREVATAQEFVVEAELTVGDDGPHSAIREACGIAIELRRFPVDLFVRAFPWPSDWSNDVVRIWITPREDRSGLLAFGLMPLPGADAAAIGIVRGEDADATAALAESCARMFACAAHAPGTPEAIGFPKSFTRIRREWGHADRYGAPGAVLLGDAAHPVSPAGGQGANMAVADAVVLAKLILAREANLVPAYEAARRRANERGIRPTRLAAKVFPLTRIPFIGALPGMILPRLFARPAIGAAVLRSLARSDGF